MMATSRPARFAASRTSVARSMWSCALPWLKFSLTTLTPALIMAISRAGSLDAGPRVATILVARCGMKGISWLVGGDFPMEAVPSGSGSREDGRRCPQDEPPDRRRALERPRCRAGRREKEKRAPSALSLHLLMKFRSRPSVKWSYTATKTEVAGSWEPPCARASARRALRENLQRRQRLALQHLQKGPAAGGDVAHVLFDAVFGNRRQRVAAASNAEGV
ncbi:MAG: hypothetical protein BWX88_05346 [Planctomycetes bacterium ADurb.Bin126]|nr:MAG: hypothetical protein BWX88_05346 [Planctomycetes bacterium ADurb.Bin126]